MIILPAGNAAAAVLANAITAIMAVLMGGRVSHRIVHSMSSVYTSALQTFKSTFVGHAWIDCSICELIYFWTALFSKLNPLTHEPYLSSDATMQKNRMVLKVD